MSPSKLGTMVAILATAAGFSALAGSAQAQISGTIGGDIVDTDALQVLGDPNITLTNGNVAFQSGHGKTDSRLTGTVHVVGGENARFRVRVESYDQFGNLLGTAYDAPDGTPVHKDVKDIPVDTEAATAAYVNRVVVAVEKQGTSDKWITKASNDTYLNLHDDYVTIAGDGIDVGGPGFGATSPLKPATVSWKIGDDGEMTATYSGTLYFNHFGRCGRVVLRSLSPSGLQVDELKGPSHCPTDDGFDHDSDTLATAPTSQANRVQVAMQSQTGGLWRDVNSQTVSIAG